MRSLVLFCIFAGVFGKVMYDGYKGLKVETPTEEGVALINGLARTGVVLIHDPSTKRPCEIAVPPALFDQVIATLEEAGLTPEKLYDNLQELVDEQSTQSKRNRKLSLYRSYGRANDLSIATYFPTFEQAIDWIYKLAGEYPNLTQIHHIGKSHEGNNQVALKIGRPGKNKPVIWIDGGIHAREWATVPTVLYIATRLLADYNSNDQRSTKALLNMYDFYLMPVFNPDGYIHTHEENRFWRKNRRPHGGYCHGVDLNRNFGHHWGESGVSFNECDDSYLGSGPFSEIETQNVRDALLGFRGRLQMYLNLHAYGQLWFIPFAYDSNAYFNDEYEHRRVAEAAVRAIYSTSWRRRTRYRVGKPGQVLYNAAGGTFDWVYAEAGAKYAFAAELSPSFARGQGLSGFHLPADDLPHVAEEVYNGVRAAIKAM